MQTVVSGKPVSVNALTSSLYHLLACAFPIDRGSGNAPVLENIAKIVKILTVATIASVDTIDGLFYLPKLLLGPHKINAATINGKYFPELGVVSLTSQRHC